MRIFEGEKIHKSTAIIGADVTKTSYIDCKRKINSKHVATAHISMKIDCR